MNMYSGQYSTLKPMFVMVVVTQHTGLVQLIIIYVISFRHGDTPTVLYYTLNLSYIV